MSSTSHSRHGEPWPDCPECETEVFVHATANSHQGTLICEFCGRRWSDD